jgi:hypothetical protein
MEDFGEFEELSTLSVQQERYNEKAREKTAKAPPAPKGPSAKIISQANKMSQQKNTQKELERTRKSVIAKLAKVEQYTHRFKGSLMGRYPKLKPDCTEEEVDLQLAQIEKELGSINAPKVTETVWLLFVKLVSIGYITAGSPGGLQIRGKVDVADLAATDRWKDEVRNNLYQLQIKYGLFESGPEVQLVFSMAKLMLEADEINKSTAAHAPREHSGEDYNKL